MLMCRGCGRKLGERCSGRNEKAEFGLEEAAVEEGVFLA